MSSTILQPDDDGNLLMKPRWVEGSGYPWLPRDADVHRLPGMISPQTIRQSLFFPSLLVHGTVKWGNPAYFRVKTQSFHHFFHWNRWLMDLPRTEGPAAATRLGLPHPSCRQPPATDEWTDSMGCAGSPGGRGVGDDGLGFGESSPFMAELFRLVNYYNLPRLMMINWGKTAISLPFGNGLNFKPPIVWWFLGGLLFSFFIVLPTDTHIRIFS